MSMVQVMLRICLVACWLAVSSISLNHLYPFFPVLSRLPVFFIGVLGWTTSFLAIVYWGRGYLRELLVLVLAFFILGVILGPFLSPPADPLEHLRRIHEANCGKTVGQLPRQNMGMWQYNMAGVLLCTDGEQVQPEKMLRKIDATSALFWAFMAASLFILGRKAGLPGRWAFLSVVICFLFFGTNRFSYFRYYSLAPTAGSLTVCWLWTAAFFFNKEARNVAAGLVAALLAMPILWVNHSQEAVFLGFIVLVWAIINISFSWGQTPLFPRAGKLVTVNRAGLILFVVTGWLLPQSDVFLQWLSQFFVRNLGLDYKVLTASWHGLYVGGKIAGLRVADTLGMTAILMILVSVPYFLQKGAEGKLERKVRIFILAVLPFIGYFVPLFHFIWSANVQSKEYYRLCYVSMYWVLFADVFFSFEKKVCGFFVWRKIRSKKPALQQLEK